MTSAPVRDPLSDHLLTPQAPAIAGIVVTDRLAKEQ
jgi:hypothetical protein